MAEETQGNGANAAPPQAQPQQQLIVNAQYIKDLSFESPRAPQTLLQPAGQPAVEVNVDVKGRNLGPEVYEVVLTINATAKTGDDPVFLVELAYGAVVSIRNTPEAMIGPLLMVETPRIIFPFARAIIADATRDGGFPPLMINPIDFGELLRHQQGQTAPPPATGLA
ncbi:MAG TPA: protein-export chaperone SecB [Stellaceae bacterium]|nr:protein-export chaperone SecB [Stellaceae bacterium]